MSIVETALIYGGFPLLGFLVIAAFVYGGSSARTPRYRPGRGWDHAPVWYLPRPVHPTRPAAGGLPALPAGGVAEPRVAAHRGGASGTW